MIEIESMALIIGTNRNNHTVRQQMEATCVVSKDFLDKIDAEIERKVREKYPSAISVHPGKISITKRLGEPRLTAFATVCIGDGDYISRVTYVDLPAIKFEGELI